MKNIFNILLAIILVLILWAFFIEPNLLIVKNIDIPLNNWHKEHENLKIVFWGDIHTKPIDLERLRKVVKVINDQEPDLVLSIGDYVNGNSYKETLYPSVIAEELSHIKSKYGFYTVLGNHDYDYNSVRIRKELEKNGINVLENEEVHFDIKGKRFWIIGIKDFTVCHTHLSRNVKRIDDSNPIILLSHTPDVFSTVPKRVNLTLAGHTHGGQVVIPFYGPLYVPSKYGKKYAKGLFKENDKKMFVTGGIGTSVLPVRFNDFPEIIILNIHSEK